MQQQVEAINVADIIEDNGKTIRQNNLEKQHCIAVGALVEVKYDTWHGDGACEVVHARLWVVSQDRDCDGTPLYSLSKTPLEKWAKNISIIYTEQSGDQFRFKEDISKSIFYVVHSGFAEESLTVIKVTEEIKQGVGSLKQ